MAEENASPEQIEEQRLIDEMSRRYGRWKYEELDEILTRVVTKAQQVEIGVGSIAPQQMLNRAALVDMHTDRGSRHDNLNFLLGGVVHMGCPNAIRRGKIVVPKQHREMVVIHPLHEVRDVVEQVTALVELAMEERIKKVFNTPEALEEAIAREVGRVTTHPDLDRMTPSQLLIRGAKLGLDAAACERLSLEAEFVNKIHKVFQRGNRHDQDVLDGIYGAARTAGLDNMALQRLLATALDEQYTPGKGRRSTISRGTGDEVRLTAALEEALPEVSSGVRARGGEVGAGGSAGQEVAADRVAGTPAATGSGRAVDRSAKSRPGETRRSPK